MKTEKQIREQIAKLEHAAGFTGADGIWRVIAALRWVLGDVDEKK